MYQQQQQQQPQQSLPGLRSSFSGQGGAAPGSGTAAHSNPYSSYGHAVHSSGAPPLPSPAASSQAAQAAPGGHAHPGHSPIASDMAAWGNTQGGARPHTADAYFGNGYQGFSALTQPQPPPAQQGAPARPPASSYGPGSNRVFAYMPSNDESPGAEAAYGGHPSSAGGPGASPYGSYATGSSTAYSSSTAPNTATSTAPSSAGTGASVSTHKKRPRRRYDEIERLYRCSWPGCTKSYGTLNHLNAHVAMQKHGAKRLPTEFKDMRRAWRKAKRDEDQRRHSSVQAQLKAEEEAMFRGRMGSLPNPGAFYPNVASGGMYPPQSRPYAAYPHPQPPPLPSTESGYPGPPPSAGSSGSGGSGGSGSAGGGGHMLPPIPGRSYSVGTAGYGMHPTGMAAPSAGASHDHYGGGGGGGSHGYGSHGWSTGGPQSGGPSHHHHQQQHQHQQHQQQQQQQQQQSSAPASSAGQGGASGLGAYLMAHRGSI
ncbi:unnamed protein product [Tilletia controversa]|nr:unnamed protein product [Tilletia controversa]